ncbi:MAG: hypothetical protein R3C59_02590 [Planctomycetaceae bacterium]
MTEIVSTRTSRSRRVVALMGWGCLVATAFLLWNARQAGSIRAVTAEPVAFILASFAAFVGVFAWMLFNPGRRSAAESPSLFFAAAATLFPPPIIGFCLMPLDSELRGWLAFGLFVLCVIAVLSHVPDEFFGVPRGRHTYFTPIPAFDRVEGTVLDPNASWFRFEDLTRIVPDTERPSLAPRAYLQRDVARTSPSARTEVRTATEVDDILGSDFDLGLLDDSLLDDSLSDNTLSGTQHTNRQYPDRSTRSSMRSTSLLDRPQTQQSIVPTNALGTADARSKATSVNALPTSPPSGFLKAPQNAQPVYQPFNPESQYLRTNQHQRRHAARQHATRRPLSRSTSHAQSLTTERTAVRGLLTRTVTEPPPTPPTVPETRRPEPVRTETPRPADPVQVALSPPVKEAPARPQRVQESVHRTTRVDNQRTLPPIAKPSVLSPEVAQAVAVASAAAMAPVALRSARSETPIEPAVTAPRQLMGQTVEQKREAKTRSEATRSKVTREADRTARRSRYDDAATRNVPEHRTAPVSPTPRTIASEPKAKDVVVEQPQPTRPVAPQELAPRKTSQPFQRTKEADGSELVEGVMRVHFDKGQKRANVHVPFSPPLAGMPEVECECIDGDDLRLKVPVRQSYGIRIEARRSNTERPLDADIGFAALCAAE